MLATDPEWFALGLAQDWRKKSFVVRRVSAVERPFVVGKTLLDHLLFPVLEASICKEASIFVFRDLAESSKLYKLARRLHLERISPLLAPIPNLTSYKGSLAPKPLVCLKPWPN